MVTLSVTRSRVAGVLTVAATIVTIDGWHPLQAPLMRAIDAAAGYVPGKGGQDAETTTLEAYDALSNHLMCPAGTWERIPGTTADDVREALLEAAREVMAP